MQPIAAELRTLMDDIQQKGALHPSRGNRDTASQQRRELGQWPLADACIGSGPADTQILQTIEEWLWPLEQFVVLLCDQTSSLNYVNKARVQLFTEKGRAINRLPPPLHRLLSFSI